MERVLEPEVMDTAEDAIEYDAMDFTEPNTKFAVDALALLGARKNGRVLDIGTGPAQIPLIMLQRDPNIEIVAVDAANEMLRVAETNVRKAGFSARCRLEKQDAKALTYEPRSFDLVISNSIAHHIPRPVDLFREIKRVAKLDAAIIVRDLIRPPTKEDAWAIVHRVSAGESKHQQQLFFDSLCAALTLSELEAMLIEADLSDLRIDRISDRHWTAERPASR